MNNKGYTLKELIIVLGVVTLVAIVAIVKTSYAFSEIDNTKEIESQEKLLIKKASLAYGESIKDRIKDEKVVIVTGEELMKNNFLVSDDIYNSVKVKLTYDEKTDKIKYEVEN